MKKEIYEVDSDGFIINNFLGEFDVEDNLIHPMGDYIITSLPQPLPFHNPKWNGSEWIEGEAKEDREAREYDSYYNKITPNKDKIQDALITIKCVEVLKEMGIG